MSVAGRTGDVGGRENTGCEELSGAKESARNGSTYIVTGTWWQGEPAM